MTQLPIVALIGQTNAGKSALFNRLTKSRTAIVAFDEGTTRDSVLREISTDQADFWLADTAGLKAPNDEFEESIQEQIAATIELSSVLLVTLDASKYPSDEDKKIAKMALRSGKPVALLLNKVDLGGALPDEEFLRLGIRDIIRVSAEHGQGKFALLEWIATALHRTDQAVKQTSPPAELKIALIGRPNVGKSSLFNALAEKQQALASSHAGTTRDVNRARLRYAGQNVEILDTAGVRRRGKQEVGIEKFSVARTLEAMLEADVCCLLVDRQEPYSAFDQALAGQIIEAGKGLILVVTKWDDVAQEIAADTADRLLAGLSRNYQFAAFAPVVLTSALTGKNVNKILELASKIKQIRSTEYKTAELNRVLHEAISAHPPATVRGGQPKLRYAVQTDTTPPWFVIYGANLENLHFSYKRYLENAWRQALDFWGTPIKFSFRNSASGGRREGKRPDRPGRHS